MILCHLICAILLALVQQSFQVSMLNDTAYSYIAAVVEFRPATDGNGTAEDLSELIRINIHNANQIIQNASQYNVDIIVFPEFGITSLANNASSILKNATEYRKYYRDVASRIPDPKDNVILCDTNATYAKSLQSISCLAQQYKMYVVANHHERVDCPLRDCAPDGFLLYNTNIVFDRKGTLIARYRKYNIHHEPGTNVTSEPEVSTFTTDFGVTFAQLIGLDLLMEQPTKQFYKNRNITDVVFSSRLFKQLPFTGSLEDQAAWAVSTDFNLLAAGYNTNLKGSGGSGIYLGKYGPVVTYRTGHLGTALLIAKVPKESRTIQDAENGRIAILNGEMLQLFNDTADRGDNSEPVIDSIFENDWKLKPNQYKIWPVKFDENRRTEQVSCIDDYCCEAAIITSEDNDLLNKNITYSYRLWMINAMNYQLSDGKRINFDFCGVVACPDTESTSCGRHNTNNTNIVQQFANFDYVGIVSFKTKKYIRRAPIASKNNEILRGSEIGRIRPTDFNFHNLHRLNHSHSSMFTGRPIDNLTLFGVVGISHEKSGANSITLSSLFSLLVFSVTYFVGY